MASEHPVLLTADDVAHVLNCSQSMAYRLMQDGSIAVVRLGRAVRVRPQDLDEFIQSRLSNGTHVGGFG
jgi:excisionase family DNA binding protein